MLNLTLIEKSLLSLRDNISCFFNNKIKNSNTNSGVAQLVERVTVNHQVGSSSLSSGAKKMVKLLLLNQDL